MRRRVAKGYIEINLSVAIFIAFIGKDRDWDSSVHVPWGGGWQALHSQRGCVVIGYHCNSIRWRVKLLLLWRFSHALILWLHSVPPHYEFRENPVRAMLLISTSPPPKLSDSKKWSAEFYNFVADCLQKNPNRRLSCVALLSTPFMQIALQRNPRKTLQMLGEKNICSLKVCVRESREKG